MSHSKSPGYSRQIILFVKGTDVHLAEPLRKKWDQMHPKNPCIMIEYDPSLPKTHSQYQLLSLLDANSRLIIIGHGRTGNDYIEGEGTSTVKITYQEIASLLSNNVHPGDVIDGDNKLKISLFVCQAAASLDKDPLNSFAGKLHRELRLKGFRTNLHARIPVVGVLPDGRKDGVNIDEQERARAKKTILRMKRKQLAKAESLGKTDTVHKIKMAIVTIEKDIKALYVHHQPESKLLFTWDADKQVVEDAYEYKAKRYSLFDSPATPSEVIASDKNGHGFSA